MTRREALPDPGAVGGNRIEAAEGGRRKIELAC